jgi:hypothetical protein
MEEYFKVEHFITHEYYTREYYTMLNILLVGLILYCNIDNQTLHYKIDVKLIKNKMPNYFIKLRCHFSHCYFLHLAWILSMLTANGNCRYILFCIFNLALYLKKGGIFKVEHFITQEYYTQEYYTRTKILLVGLILHCNIDSQTLHYKIDIKLFLKNKIQINFIKLRCHFCHCYFLHLAWILSMLTANGICRNALFCIFTLAICVKKGGIF